MFWVRSRGATRARLGSGRARRRGGGNVSAAARAEDDIGALRGEQLGAGLSDAGRGAGDDDGLAGDVVAHDVLLLDVFRTGCDRDIVQRAPWPASSMRTGKAPSCISASMDPSNAPSLTRPRAL